MTPRLTALLLAALSTLPVAAQQEGLLPTQALVHADSKDNAIPSAQAITLELDGKRTPLTSIAPLPPARVQVALLIDDGLSRSAGVQLQDLQSFASSLPPTTELLVGYMSNGRVIVAAPFTTDHAAAAKAIRLPLGSPGQSASPYLCLSDFSKRWPGARRSEQSVESSGLQSSLEDTSGPAGKKARFVIMITNGVDPYNGSVSITNQNSPYVLAAIADAQRAGLSVSSIYYSDAGMGGDAASFSGQSYLKQLSDGTGGEAYYQGTFNPVSLKPFLAQFAHAISETYVASFGANAQAGGRDHLVRLKMSTTTPKLKLRHPEAVRPGNQEISTQP